MTSVSENHDYVESPAQANTVRLAFPRSKICRLFITYSVSWFVCISLSHRLTHPFNPSMTVIKHAPSQPSFIPYIHCQAAMTPSPTMHFKYALCWRQIEFRVCLSFKRCGRELGAWSGRGMWAATVWTDQQPWALVKEKGLLSHEGARVTPRRLPFTFIPGSTRDSLWRQSRLCVSFWSERRFLCNLRHLRGWE